MSQLLEALITDAEIDLLEEREGLRFSNSPDSEKTDRRSLLKNLKSIDVQACPGSGKTTLIAAKLILLAHNWPHKHRGVCVLSHTNVAKNEIISRLERSKTATARKLLSYPHFIGTIQEFINKFLGIPYLRSCGIEVNMIDTNFCVEQIRRRMDYSTRVYIERKSNFRDVLFDFELKISNEDIEIIAPTFPLGSPSPSCAKLKAIKNALIKEGVFFYRDLYVYAEMILKKNAGTASFLQNRFPVVFVDEMQDTQGFQDDLLRNVFPLDLHGIAVQRFGDPDQAIFNGINNEEPNQSYNGRANMDYVINLSHRFDQTVADKIKSLSFNCVPLASELKEEDLQWKRSIHSGSGDFAHTIFVYDTSTIEAVIPKFATLVSQQFIDAHKRSEGFTVKVVGAVGNEIDPEKRELKIGHYWNGYDKNKSKNTYKPESLIAAIYYSRNLPRQDLADGYSFLSHYVIDMLRQTQQGDANGKWFSATSWKDHLKNNGAWTVYREFMCWALDPNAMLTQAEWESVAPLFCRLLGVRTLPADIANLVEYAAEVRPQPQDGGGGELTQVDNNVLEHSGGFRLHLSTIHGVKGETHDATLIVETKNYCHDVQAMLQYISGVLPSGGTNSALKTDPSTTLDPSKMANQKFMRQLYVGMSRARHLLCLAINRERLSEAERQKLQTCGWKIEDI
jgi:DNA helicase-2/ATP-dependent DNA helicase PcrA